jgi:multidrug resistance efflux pump
MIRDLSTKLHAARSEKGAAFEVARTAHAALAQTERDLRAAEAALINAQVASERAQREVQEARATVHDLRAKLSLASQSIGEEQAQLREERQGRIAAERALSAPPVPSVANAVGEARTEPPAKRRRGRPTGKRDASVPPSTAGTTGRSDADQAPVKWWLKG